MNSSPTEPAQVPAKPNSPESGVAKPRPARKAKERAKARGKQKAVATPKGGSKSAKILRLLQRPHGATLAELTKATEWQAHSVRGFLSGSVKHKMRLKIAHEKREDGTRFYRINS